MEKKIELKDLVVCAAIDAVEALLVVGDIIALAHGVYLLSKGRTEEALFILGNVNPTPLSLGCLLSYLVTGRLPV